MATISCPILCVTPPATLIPIRLKPECFIDSGPLKWYPKKDYHNVIIGRIEAALIKA